MKMQKTENTNQERYNATSEIVDFDLMYYFKTEVMPIMEDLVELKNLAYYGSKQDFEEHRNVCVNLINSLAEVLKQGSENLEEFT